MRRQYGMQARRADRRVRPGRKGSAMRAVKARFDGENIALPEEAKGQPPGEVIVVFQDADSEDADKAFWLAVQEEAFAAAWDGEQDAMYDDL